LCADAGLPRAACAEIVSPQANDGALRVTAPHDFARNVALFIGL
jgi:hypothetical protein